MTPLQSVRKPRRDRTGERYGRLTVTGYADYDERSMRHRWWVRCSCPKHRVFKTPTTNLTSGKTKGCGCLNGSHRVINLMGAVFGYLTVTGRAPARQRPLGARWICLCQCGNVTEVGSQELRNGDTKSCGCRSSIQRINMLGKTFGSLTVIGRGRPHHTKRLLWLCGCTCGTHTEVRGWDLRNGRTKSCGCLRKTWHRLRHPSGLPHEIMTP